MTDKRGTGVHVRPATPEDAAGVVRINVQTWQSTYRGMVPDDILDNLGERMDERVERTRERWSSPEPLRFPTLVTHTPSGIVGFVTYGPYRVDQSPDQLDESVGEVLAIYVELAHQGRGVGRALMDAAVDELRTKGVTKVRLWTLTENSPTRRFYERYGFHADGAEYVYPMPRPNGSRVELPEVRYTLEL